MSDFKVGDLVEVLDEGLAMLRKWMGPKAKINHFWRVDKIMDNGDLLIEFPIDGSYEHSQVAPYPPGEVRHRQQQEERRG